jgi:peptidoglycan hydrolase-like protein with peptidoglycan-binding domain
MSQLPQWLDEFGLPYIQLDGWKANEQGYYWVQPNGTHTKYTGYPSAHLVHHTASSSYKPYVKNSSGQTKANVWVGLWDGTRLHVDHPTAEPMLVLASAGPADYSSGKGVKALLTDYMITDKRFKGPQPATDDYPRWYGNRYYWNTEVVHPGYGETLNSGVYDALIGYCNMLSDKMGWSIWRNAGHYDHTRRKVDPRFGQGYPYSIARIQDDALLWTPTGPTPPPVEPPPEDDEMILPDLPPYAGYNSHGMTNLRENVKIMQRELNGQGYPDPRTIDPTPCAADGYHGPGSQEALNGFKGDKGLPKDGVCDDETWRVLLKASN